ncbi:MAG TPA: insulinase family protein [Polyangiaceae bacterium]|nr:insulinase family protein [Polyangiaceae bacterium]
MRPRPFFAALVALLVALAACGPAPRPEAAPPRPPAAAPPPAPRAPEDQPLPLWPEVRSGKLANGLTYYVLKHHKPEKRAFLWLAVNAGSVLEDDDQRGLAHFDEHMAFNGTRRFPKAEIINYLEKIGMRFGADLNAYTGFDQTVYQLEVPTDDPAFMAKGFDILRDWASEVTYDPAEVEKERGVVLEEWRLGRGASQRLFDKQAKVLFKGSRYAERLPIGQPEVLKGAPRAALVRFYQDWYRPDLTAVIAVGDFADEAAVEREIAARFGDLKGPPAPKPRPAAGVPKAEGTRVSIETDREQPTTTVSVYNMLPHRPESTPRDLRRALVEQVYQTVLNERLGVIARKKDAPFAGASAGVQSMTREIDAFARSARAKGGKVDEALRALFAEVLRVERHGVTQSELDRARTNIARAYEQNAAEEATMDSRQFSDEITRHFFEAEYMIGRAAERDFALKFLPTVSLDELNSLAKGFGGADNRVIVVAGPDGKPLPTKERVLALVDEVAKAALEPWEDKAVSGALLAQPPKPGAIVKEGKIEAIGVTEWTLSNGVRVVVKPTDFEADSVLVEGSSPGGLATASAAQFADARFADDVAPLGGVGELDVDALAKVLAGKRVAAAASIGETTDGIEAASSARDVETMFQLIYLRMTAPRKDDDAIAVWRANTAERLADRLRVPEVQFSLRSGEVLWKNNPRRLPPQPADVQKFDANKAFDFYRARFADATDFTFVVVGAVDLAKLRPLVETYLASLPAKGRVEKERDVGARRVAGVVKKSWALGQEPKARVTMLYHGDEPWARDKERDLYVLGRVLSIRLREVLREDLGGVYGVGAGGGIARAPHQERSFSINFGCDPARAGELIKATHAEIAAIAANGIGDGYLEKIRQIFLRERETQLKTNRVWASWLSNSRRFNDDPTIILDPSGMLARMTSERVKAAAKHYLDGKHYYEAVMLPAAEAAPKAK